MDRTLIAPVSFGLGDLVVSLPAIQALVVEDSPVWLVARSSSQRLLAERIAGLAGVIDEADLTDRHRSRLVDLRDHPIQRDYWWGSADFERKYGRLNINEIIQRICRDFGIYPEFECPTPLRANPRADLRRTVLLVHESDGAYKTWPADRWAAVASALRADGYDVAQVTKQPDVSPLDGVPIPAVVAPNPGDAVDVLSGCRAVIGVDTGLTHIAVQQGTPTVTICRRHSVYQRPWPHSAVLRGESCTEQCLASEASYAYNRTVSLRDFRPPARTCPSEAACLAGARPEDAVGLLRDLL